MHFCFNSLGRFAILGPWVWPTPGFGKAEGLERWHYSAVRKREAIKNDSGNPQLPALQRPVQTRLECSLSLSHSFCRMRTCARARAHACAWPARACAAWTCAQARVARMHGRTHNIPTIPKHCAQFEIETRAGCNASKSQATHDCRYPARVVKLFDSSFLVFRAALFFVLK